MDRAILDYLPPAVRDLREMRALAAGQERVLSALWDAVKAAFNDQYAASLSENGVSRWEKILGITPKGGDTLGNRRTRVLTRLLEQIPVTKRTLNQQLLAMCGKNGYRMELDPARYTLGVLIAVNSSALLSSVGELVRKSVPANLLVQVGYLYNRHRELSPFGHEELGRYTHRQLREVLFIMQTYQNVAGRTQEQLAQKKQFEIAMEA